MAVVVGTFSLLLVILFWNNHIKNNRNSFRRHVIANGSYTASEFENTVSQHILALKNLADRIEHTDGAYFNNWAWDADRIIAQHSSYKFIEWIDSGGVIRKVKPNRGNQRALGLNILKLSYRAGAWQNAILDSSLNITGWTDLKQGGSAFLMDDPVFYNQNFQGTITGGLDFTRQFDEEFGSDTNFVISLRDHQGRIFYHFGDSLAAVDRSDLQYRENISLPDQKIEWQFLYRPTRSYYNEQVFWSNRIGLILGVVLSLLLGVVTYFAQRTFSETAHVKRVNVQLQQLNLELDRERKRAEMASRGKTDFLSNMSHEIRTPLNALIGFIGIMKNQNHAPDNEKYLEMMDFSSKALLSLVNDILEIDKIESGRISMHQQAFSPSEEVMNLVELFAPGFREKGIELHLSFNNKDEVVLGDVVKFNQIFTNLIRNAFKFTVAGGVEVNYSETAKAETVDIRISIHDSGIGIPPDKVDSIFERFSQVDSSIKRKYEGSGLGLAITYQLVQLMGGKIGVQSSEDKGSVFTVDLSFPRENREELAHPDHLNEKQAHFKNKRILIVEDNAMNVIVLSKVLEQFGIESEVANNGLEALDMIHEDKFDLVFMDIHMPEMDGFEATRAIRLRGYQKPVIGLSANVTREAIDESKLAGMQDYITKPFSRQKLLRILIQYLSN